MLEMFHVCCRQDVLKDAVESNMQSATEMPYFEGDFWPNILEESIKELDEEEDKRRREEMEAAATSAADIEELTTEKEDSGEVCSCNSSSRPSTRVRMIPTVLCLLLHLSNMLLLPVTYL